MTPEQRKECEELANKYAIKNKGAILPYDIDANIRINAFQAGYEKAMERLEHLEILNGNHETRIEMLSASRAEAASLRAALEAAINKTIKNIGHLTTCKKDEHCLDGCDERTELQKALVALEKYFK